jgi:hypothetical protein
VVGAAVCAHIALAATSRAVHAWRPSRHAWLQLLALSAIVTATAAIAAAAGLRATEVPLVGGRRWCVAACVLTALSASWLVLLCAARLSHSARLAAVVAAPVNLARACAKLALAAAVLTGRLVRRAVALGIELGVRALRLLGAVLDRLWAFAQGQALRNKQN